SNLENAANYQTWLVNNAIESAIYHDDHRITLKLNASTNPRELLSIRLMPAHFYKRSGWPKAFDYLFEPTTGPYVQVRTESKRRILFKRQDNWWANDEPFFKNRFNPKNITLELVQPRYRYYDNLKAGHLDMAIYKHARPSNTEKVAINELLQTLPINRYSINSVEPLYRVLIKNRTFDSPASLISCLQDLNGESLTSVTESFQWTQSEPKPDQFIESPCLEVVKFLKKGEFTYLALNIRAHSEQHIENYLQSLAQYSDQLEVQAVRIPDLQQGYVAWQWIKLPDDLQALTDPLDPFDPVHGGLFWIDPQVKHNTLSRNFWRWPEPGKTIDLSE
ncbi:MAG: ABC transporter substrate-binding protein, partial [Oceanobacter sp.]